MRGGNAVPIDVALRRRTYYLVEVCLGGYLNFRGEEFDKWSINSNFEHPEFANQKADVLRAAGFRVRVRPVLR